MKIRVIPPDEYYKLDDLHHRDRWMCPRCALILDYLFDHDGPGWPKFEPPLHVMIDWVDEEGELQFDEPERSEVCPRCSLDFGSDPPKRISIREMNRPEDLDQIISEGEGERLEFKEAFPESADRLRNIIASFATTRGGRILFGVDDAGKVNGLPDVGTVSGKDAFQQRIRGLLGGIEPKVDLRIDFFSDGQGIDLAMATIPKGSSPIYISGGTIYTRSLDETRPASAEEVQRLVAQSKTAKER